MVNLGASASWGAWGIHINVWSNQSNTPNCPQWARPLQKKDWHERGVVIWDEQTQQITRCYAKQVLGILKALRETNDWKQNGYVVGVPAYRIVLPSNKRKKNIQLEQTSPEEKSDAGWVLTHTVDFTPRQTEELFKFLEKSESILEQIAEIEKKEAREALGKVYSMILEWGRERMERRASNGEIKEKPEIPVEKKVIPTSVPSGKYFSIDQVAEICRTTPTSVKKWIEKGQLLSVSIPGAGKLVELQELNRFLEKIGQPTIEG